MTGSPAWGRNGSGGGRDKAILVAKCYVQQKHITTELRVNASLLKELQRQQPGIWYNCEACASA